MKLLKIYFKKSDLNIICMPNGKVFQVDFIDFDFHARWESVLGCPTGNGSKWILGLCL